MDPSSSTEPSGLETEQCPILPAFLMVCPSKERYGHVTRCGTRTSSLIHGAVKTKLEASHEDSAEFLSSGKSLYFPDLLWRGSEEIKRTVLGVFCSSPARTYFVCVRTHTRVCMCACMCTCVCIYATVCTVRSKNSLWEFIFYHFRQSGLAAMFLTHWASSLAALHLILGGGLYVIDGILHTLIYYLFCQTTLNTPKEFYFYFFFLV